MAGSRDRARSLDRIAAVQAEMTKLAEWKLGAANRRSRVLEDEADLLASFASGDAPGTDLAKAVVRKSRALAARRLEAEQEIAAYRARLDALRRRGHAVAGLAAEARRAVVRDEEAAALAETVEAWLARAGASLP